MDKILVIVYVPMIDEKFELFIPLNKKVGTVKKLLITGINQLSEIDLQSPIGFCLQDKETGTIYDENKTVLENKIENSTEMLLI